MTQRALRAATLPMLVACAASALGLCACLDNKVANTEVDGQTSFIAQNDSFADYSNWMTFDTNVSDDHGGLVGTTTVYLKQLPPTDATAFPVGTLIVKTMQATDSDTMTIHAMAKRGVGFNVAGTLGWEFFELALNKSGVPFILWRGENPPTGEQYQALLSKANLAPSMLEETCNSCHENGTDGTFTDLAALIQAP